MDHRRFAADGNAVTAVSMSAAAAAPKRAPVSTSAFQPGEVVGGRYIILQLLGEGGMGAVYKAQDRELDRVVALKTIRPEFTSHADALQRFKQELILARQISHPNVIRVFDLGESGGTRFITMEFVDGGDLGEVLRTRGKLPPQEAAEIMLQVFRALSAAHRERVIHRDLKPANVMRDAQGKVAVMDFGLARSSASAGLTQTGALIGTLEYMSPEQANGKPIDARSDIYSAGLIFYELLIGKSAFEADSSLASLVKRSRERALSPTKIDASVSIALSDIVTKCLELDLAARYQSADEVVRDLEAALGTSPTAIVRVVPARIKIALWIAAAAALVLLALAGLLGLRFRSAPAVHAPLTVLVADFRNETGDPVFEGALESAFGLSMEGASFINTYRRDQARNLAAQLQPGAKGLDENLARLVSVREGLNVVVAGEVRRRGEQYQVNVRAEDGISTRLISSANATVDSKDKVLLAMGTLAARIRRALGDTTPESQQLAAAETYSAHSIEAAHEYAKGQELLITGKWDDAIAAYTRAVELDPQLGRAYSGLAVIYTNLRQRQPAEKYYQLALQNIDRMTEREQYRTRASYYLSASHNPGKAIEELNALLKLYPVDSAGLANLALAHFYLRDMEEALATGRRAVKISPRSLMQRNNVAYYAMYAGDFDAAVSEATAALELNNAYVKPYIALALSQAAQGRLGEAEQTYARLQKVNARGASIASMGLADLALYQGHGAAAQKLLEGGIADDLGWKDAAAGIKLVILASLQLERGEISKAVLSTERAVTISQTDEVLVSAGRLYLRAHQDAKAHAIAAQLGSRTEPDPQAYAKMIEGEFLLERGGDVQKAIKIFSEAQRISDTWLGRFLLGRAYLQAGAFAEAHAEFENCLKRRGEAAAVFLEDVPSLRYLPSVYYYMGRAQEGLRSPAATESYKTFLRIKQTADADPLVADARRRMASPPR